MQTRLLIITLALLAAIMVSAQEETPLADEPAATEEPAAQDQETPQPGAIDEVAAEAAVTGEVEAGEPGLDSFRPSEEISADRSVAFPNDI